MNPISNLLSGAGDIDLSTGLTAWILEWDVWLPWEHFASTERWMGEREDLVNTERQMCDTNEASTTCWALPAFTDLNVGCQVLYAFCCFLPSRSPAMGNLIKVLGKDLENCPHFFLDFESKWASGRVHVAVHCDCGAKCGVGGQSVVRGRACADASC